MFFFQAIVYIVLCLCLSALFQSPRAFINTEFPDIYGNRKTYQRVNFKDIKSITPSFKLPFPLILDDLRFP